MKQLKQLTRNDPVGSRDEAPVGVANYAEAFALAKE